MASVLKLTWMADLKLETDLRALSVTSEVGTIPFSKIDLAESQYNGARLGDPIVHVLVEDYRIGMENGDTFPRIAVYKGKAGYVILSGNQRAAAIKQFIDEGRLPQGVMIEVYIIDVPDKLLQEIIARSGNVGHGGRCEKDERLAHAVYSVRKLGLRVKDAAKLFEVSETSINVRIRAETARTGLAREGINVSHVPVSTLASLAPLDTSAKIKLGHLIAQHNPTAERVKQTVKAVRKARSQNGRLQQIKRFEKELTEEAHRSTATRSGNARKVPRRPRRDRLIGDLTRLATYLESGMDGERFARLDDFQLAGDADADTIRKLWKQVEMRMRTILRSH